MKKKSNKLFEELIRKQDPRFLDWGLLALDDRLTEELIREYEGYISNYNWLDIYLHQGFSDDFIKEFNLDWLVGD